MKKEIRIASRERFIWQRAHGDERVPESVLTGTPGAIAAQQPDSTHLPAADWFVTVETYLPNFVLDNEAVPALYSELISGKAQHVGQFPPAGKHTHRPT